MSVTRFLAPPSWNSLGGLAAARPAAPVPQLAEHSTGPSTKARLTEAPGLFTGGTYCQNSH